VKGFPRASFGELLVREARGGNPTWPRKREKKKGLAGGAGARCVFLLSVSFYFIVQWGWGKIGGPMVLVVAVLALCRRGGREKRSLPGPLSSKPSLHLKRAEKKGEKRGRDPVAPRQQLLLFKKKVSAVS